MRIRVPSTVSGGMEARRSRLPLAILVAVAAAGAATFLLRPRSGLIEPAAGRRASVLHAPSSWTGPRTSAASSGCSGVGGLVVSTGTLALLAWRPPRRCSSGSGRRPLLGGGRGRGGHLAAAGGGRPAARRLARTSAPSTSGLATQGWPDGSATWPSRPAIGPVFAAAGGALALALVRRFPRNWWAPGAPWWSWRSAWSRSGSSRCVIDPLFNDFEKLPAGAAALGRARAGATRPASTWARSTGSTPAAARRPPTPTSSGLGPHEAGGALRQPDHEPSRATRCGWWWRTSWATRSTTTCSAACSGSRSWRPAGTFLAQRLAERFGAPLGPGRPEPASPGRSCCPPSRSPWRWWRSAWAAPRTCSRAQVEARADAFALDLTRGPGGVRPVRAAARAAQHLRPRPAAALPRRCSAPIRRRSSGSASARRGRSRE